MGLTSSCFLFKVYFSGLQPKQKGTETKKRWKEERRIRVLEQLRAVCPATQQSVCLYLYKRAFICMCIYIYGCVHACMCVCACTCAGVCVLANKGARSYVTVCRCVCRSVCLSVGVACAGVCISVCV